MQFQLSTIFLLFVVCASALSLGAWAVLLAVYFVFVAWVVRCFLVKPAERIIGLLLAIFGPLIVTALLLPAISFASEAARRAMCVNNMRQLGLALHNYHDANGQFPPPYVADADGKPMHSWHVLLLPYVEEQALYGRYRFDEPWNGPNNRKLLAECPWCYRCPSRVWKSEDQPTTSYVAVTGPETVWAVGKANRMDNIPDGAENTILLVEIADSEIPWTKPYDLTMEEVLAADAASSRAATSHHYNHSFFWRHRTD